MRVPSGRVGAAGAVLIALIAMTSAGRAQEATTFDHAGLARQALETHIRPGYAAVVTSAQTLAKELDGYCTRQTGERRRAVDRAFDGLVSSWGRIEHIRFGPIATGNRLERLFFWPDRRGLGARQVAATLRERDPSALDPVALTGKRVAIQGLGALETALFEAPSKHADDRAYRCAFAKSIATNIANIASAILREWTDPDLYSHHWLDPGPGNPHFLKRQETTLALAKALDNGLERVRDEWIAAPLGLGPQRRRLTPVLATSGRTLRLFLAGVEGLHRLFTTAGMHKAIIDTTKAHPDVTVPLNAGLAMREIETARDELRRLVRQGRRFDPDSMMQQLVAVGFPLKNARLQVVALLGLTAGISMGFNASDGD
jgi:predicted lipoprotein